MRTKKKWEVIQTIDTHFFYSVGSKGNMDNFLERRYKQVRQKLNKLQTLNISSSTEKAFLLREYSSAKMDARYWRCVIQMIRSSGKIIISWLTAKEHFKQCYCVRFQEAMIILLARLGCLHPAVNKQWIKEGFFVGVL